MIGRYSFLLYCRSFAGNVGETSNSLVKFVRSESELADLHDLGITDAQRAWFDAGSLCVWLPDTNGEPAACAWCHTDLHVDRYVGRWSKPRPGVAYGNALFTRPDLRGQGFARRVLSDAAASVSVGRFHTLRVLVSPHNVASVRIHHLAGYSVDGRCVGLRLHRFNMKVRLPISGHARHVNGELDLPLAHGRAVTGGRSR